MLYGVDGLNGLMADGSVREEDVFRGQGCGPCLVNLAPPCLFSSPSSHFTLYTSLLTLPLASQYTQCNATQTPLPLPPRPPRPPRHASHARLVFRTPIPSTPQSKATPIDARLRPRSTAETDVLHADLVLS